ncbi:MAG: prepilin-type N-terminal cleavage/methylation domain-containing protein [bacterium]|nr:prepilin-type N-terminal cleavage/methylation domain-containing protein [bacterium]
MRGGTHHRGWGRAAGRAAGAARGGGFTLLEVLIAIVIFAVTLAALTTTLTTGIHAWNTGHGLSEIFQTARITQDVVLRDMNNLIYRQFNTYNRIYLQQLDELQRREEMQGASGRSSAGGAERGKQADTWGGVTPRNMAPPVDLTFIGANQGKLDRLTFTRSYRPRTNDEAPAWGLRRISYYVKGGVLYREEKDAFGAPVIPDDEVTIGNALTGREAGRSGPVPGMRDLASNNPLVPINSAGESTYDRQPRDRYRNLFKKKTVEEIGLALPTRVSYSEPLCEGVEIFNVTYGYFKDGQWREVDEWNSSASRYRNPVEELGLARNQGINLGSDRLLRVKTPPDELPGYVAVQVGVRAPGGGSRLYSFTFFYSVPEAQETDMMRREVGEPPVAPDFQPPARRRGEYEREARR